LFIFYQKHFRGLAVCSSDNSTSLWSARLLSLCGAHNMLKGLAERTTGAVMSQRSTVLPTSNWPAARGREQDAAGTSSFHRACPRQASPLAMAETRMLRGRCTTSIHHTSMQSCCSQAGRNRSCDPLPPALATPKHKSARVFPEQPLPLGLARHKERGTSQPLPTKAAAQTAARHPLAPLLREHQVHFPFCVRCAHTWAAANPRARRWLGYQVQACAAAAPRTGGPRGCACSVVVILAARVAAVAAAGIAVVVPVAPAAAAAAAAAACAVAAAAAAPAAAKVTTAAALVRPWRY